MLGGYAEVDVTECGIGTKKDRIPRNKTTKPTPNKDFMRNLQFLTTALSNTAVSASFKISVNIGPIV